MVLCPPVQHCQQPVGTQGEQRGSTLGSSSAREQWRLWWGLGEERTSQSLLHGHRTSLCQEHPHHPHLPRKPLIWCRFHLYSAWQIQPHPVATWATRQERTMDRAPPQMWTIEVSNKRLPLGYLVSSPITAAPQEGFNKTVKIHAPPLTHSH